MRKVNWTPYLLLAPTVLYLLLFFAYPMVEALRLAVRGPGTGPDDQLLQLYTEPDETTEITDSIRKFTEFSIIDRTTRDEVLASGRTRPVYWFLIGPVEESTESFEGWAKFNMVDLDGSRQDAETGQVIETNFERTVFTTRFIERMIEDSQFDDAIITTGILMLIILPIQFTLAIVMALVLQAALRGSSLYLYIFAIPLGVSDLATGLIWLSIFTQNGFMNTVLEGLGLIDQKIIFISPNNVEYMYLAIVLAEVWRATSIVMVIVVAGLQAIPGEFIEAGQIFGANLWQRLWYIILPLLKPSLQVALILRTILALQVFAVVLAITGQGLTVLAGESYDWYAIRNNENVAAAYAGLIMILSLGISMFYLRAVRSQEEANRAS